MSNVQAELQSALLGGAYDWSDTLTSAAISARLLREDPRIRNALAATSPAEKAAADDALVAFASINPAVAQVRLLSSDGRERIRVHGGSVPAVVSDGLLQSKSRHDYYKQSMGMPLGSIHLSPINHNREYGEIEYPLNPTLRMVLPVQALSGAGKAGLLVINFNARPLLAQLELQSRAVEGGIVQSIVVNQDGAFLRHPQQEREWGFERKELNQLLHRQGAAGGQARPLKSCDLSLRCSEPALWSNLQRATTGQWSAGSGLWVWREINSSTVLKINRSTASAGPRVTPRRWWLLGHVPAAALQQRLNQRLAAYRAIGFAALAIIGAVSLLVVQIRRRELISRFQLQQERAAFGLLAEHAADVVFALHQGRITWVSGSISRYSSAAHAHWQQKRALAFVHPQQRRSVLEAIARLPLHQSITLRLQARLEGSRYDWIELQAKHVANEDDWALRPIIAASFQLINDQINHEREIAYRASHDELTGLLSRRTILEQLEAALASDEQRDPRMALLFVDLDAFKAINDTYGHADGDLVLRQTADRMRRSVRDNDAIGRLGGDELLVVLNNIHSVDDAMDIARKVHHACSQPVQADGYAIHASVSVGVALGRPGESIDELQARADQALYKAKANGRNQVILISDEGPSPDGRDSPELRAVS